MKLTHTTPKPPKFEPVDLTITMDSLKELEVIYAIFNSSRLRYATQRAFNILLPDTHGSFDDLKQQLSRNHRCIKTLEDCL